MPDRLSFVAVGPQKTATTWLARQLAGCAQLCLPGQVKETFFWDRRFDRGEAWYFGHFTGTGQRMECAPTYFHAPEATKRLKRHNPDLRVIITLRDPAERAFSLYLHHYRKGRVGADFRASIGTFPEILDASHYGRHISRWLDAFGRDQVLVLMQDEIEAAPDAVFRRVTDFLGIDPVDEPGNLRQRVNVGGSPRSRALAGLTTRLNDFLRSRGLHGIVNFAKSLGLKKLVYGPSDGKTPRITTVDRQWLIAQFEQDIDYVEKLLSLRLDRWRQVGGTDETARP